MHVVIMLKGTRGLVCFKRLLDEKVSLTGVVLQNQPTTDWFRDALNLSQAAGIPVLSFDDPNSDIAKAELEGLRADLFVLAGYGKILSEEILRIPPMGCLNLHGGRLPAQRGSAPLNWALIRGCDEFGISILRAEAGVDTGDILSQQFFPIEANETIADLHAKANQAFPEMLMGVLDDLEGGTLQELPQNPDEAAYYPVRFPEDGLVLFDTMTAAEIHNLIRALAAPYPGAHTYLGGRKIRLVASRLRETDFFGVPGRVYLIRENSLLVCAKDKSLWLDGALFENDKTFVAASIQRYARLATVSQVAEMMYMTLGENS